MGFFEKLFTSPEAVAKKAAELKAQAENEDTSQQTPDGSVSGKAAEALEKAKQNLANKKKRTEELLK